MFNFHVSLTLAAMVALAGCAHNVTSGSITASLVPTKVGLGNDVKKTNAVTLTLESNYQRTIEKDSTWVKVGSVNQGDVYKRVGDVFTVEGQNVHEAYLVVARNSLVGFYLPLEKAFLKSIQSPIIFRD